jgi:hypothetical protein
MVVPNFAPLPKKISTSERRKQLNIRPSPLGNKIMTRHCRSAFAKLNANRSNLLMRGDSTDCLMEMPQPPLSKAKASAVTAIVRNYVRKGRCGSDIDSRLQQFTTGNISSTTFCDALQERGLKALSNAVRFVIDPPDCVAPSPSSKWSANEDLRLLAAIWRQDEFHWDEIAASVGGKTKFQCRRRWEVTFMPDVIGTRSRPWSPDEDERLRAAVKIFDHKWVQVTGCVPGRSTEQCRHRWQTMNEQQRAEGLAWQRYRAKHPDEVKPDPEKKAVIVGFFQEAFRVEPATDVPTLRCMAMVIHVATGRVLERTARRHIWPLVHYVHAGIDVLIDLLATTAGADAKQFTSATTARDEVVRLTWRFGGHSATVTVESDDWAPIPVGESFNSLCLSWQEEELSWL